MQLRSHRDEAVAYIFEIFLCRFEIFPYPWISLNTTWSSNMGISMRLRLACSPAFVGSVIVPALGPYRHFEEGPHALNGYTPCFSAPFLPSRFISRFPSLFLSMLSGIPNLLNKLVPLFFSSEELCARDQGCADNR